MTWNKMTKATKKEVDFIDDKIVQFNSLKMNLTDKDLFVPINFVIKNENKKVIAGIVGQKYYCSAAYIDVLWVDDAVRGQGLGTQLLIQFEKIAKELNCFMVHLDTFDFQAPAFYEKNGYTLYATLNDNPPGISVFISIKSCEKNIELICFTKIH